MRNKSLGIKKRLSALAFILIFFPQLSCLAQLDSIVLPEVTIKAYLGETDIMRSPSSVALIDSGQIHKQTGHSLVPVLNTVPGLRMEERSPGSYRLSIRGSLIRSPFGIRNVKVYLDEFALTNAGGETYLNLIDLNSINSVEVLKGPDGSLFGANSGGVVRLNPTGHRKDKSYISAGVGAGSYGLLQQHINLQQPIGNNIFSITEAWQHSDGYRKNSSMDRKFIQVSNRVNYMKDAQLRFLFFYSDLQYKTPGGLTLAQSVLDQREARLPTKTLPGAIEQNAGIHNRTFFGGILHDTKISKRVSHVLSIFGSQTLFENPFITNYEVRNENNVGARTWFEFRNKTESKVLVKLNIGGEIQEMNSLISNYGNRKGFKDTVQAIDNVEARQAFIFSRLVIDFFKHWLFEASVSYNYNRFIFSRREPFTGPLNTKNFTPQLMPRCAASYKINPVLSLRAIVSRGYSPPTLQEIRSSDNNVNTALQPENGFNYEGGFRLKTKNGFLSWDVSAYYYELKHAIVKRINDNGQDYFLNAGGTYQPGLESQVTLNIIKLRYEKFIRGLQLTNAFTYNAFKFGNYSDATANYTGKSLTGVPLQVSVTGLTLSFPFGLYLFSQYNYTDRIPLNDGNTEYAAEYHLIQLKAGWKFMSKKKFGFDLNAGVDNLADQSYSLGNDLNAMGNRYYNFAPKRNYFVRVVFFLM